MWLPLHHSVCYDRDRCQSARTNALCHRKAALGPYRYSKRTWNMEFCALPTCSPWACQIPHPQPWVDHTCKPLPISTTTISHHGITKLQEIELLTPHPNNGLPLYILFSHFRSIVPSTCLLCDSKPRVVSWFRPFCIPLATCHRPFASLRLSWNRDGDVQC